MKKITIILLTALVSMGAMAQGKIEMTLSEGWQFSRDNINWESVTVPHDWAISGPFDKKWDLQVVAIKENGEDVATEKSGRSGALPWIGKENPLLINDERYAPASVLAPKQYSDLAFTMHMLSHLKETGTCAIVEFPGVLYRGKDEQKIRQYLVSNNYVDTIIQLPENLFFGVSIATCILVLKKSAKRDSSILFIDASKLFDKVGNKNVLSPKYRKQIVAAFAQRKDIPYLCKLVSNDEVLDNKSNLSVSSYVEKEDAREVINIEEVNERLSNEIVPEGIKLRKLVDEIIATL